jgi:putative transposase
MLSAAYRLMDSGAEMSTPTISYKNHRFPPQIIAGTVWLYFRFPLSLRLVEEMLLERGIVVSYETIRRWGRRRDRPNPPRHQRCQAIACQTTEEARPYAKTDHHRQAALVRHGKTRCHAQCRTWSHKSLNNQVENSHLPLRKRERMMQGSRPVGGLQRFISVLFSG